MGFKWAFDGQIQYLPVKAQFQRVYDKTNLGQPQVPVVAPVLPQNVLDLMSDHWREMIEHGYLNFLEYPREDQGPPVHNPKNPEFAFQTVYEKYDRGYLWNINAPNEKYRIVRVVERPFLDHFTFKEVQRFYKAGAKTICSKCATTPPPQVPKPIQPIDLCDVCKDQNMILVRKDNKLRLLNLTHDQPTSWFVELDPIPQVTSFCLLNSLVDAPGKPDFESVVLNDESLAKQYVVSCFDSTIGNPAFKVHNVEALFNRDVSNSFMTQFDKV